MDIIKNLNRKARPDGYFKLKLLIRMRGSRDYKNSQVCFDGETYLTPWLCCEVRALAAYEDRIFLKVDQALEAVSLKVASEIEELENLAPGKPPENLDEENMQRKSAEFNSKLLAIQARRTEIMLDLAKQEAIIESIDTALKHHLESAEHIIREHTSFYWAGVLKAAANTDMPAQPRVDIPDIIGVTVYELHRERIKEKLNIVLKSDATNHESEVKEIA